MKYFIIDGNNLIGKISLLWKLQQKDKQSSREKLAFMLDRYFAGKNYKVSLHFDGFKNQAIRVSNLKIYYSEKKTADEKIKLEIDKAKNPRLISVVSSDQNLMDYAKLNSCEVIKSEKFGRRLSSSKSKNEEEELIKKIDNDEIKKLFGL